jgi:hypothetical protein
MLTVRCVRVISDLNVVSKDINVVIYYVRVRFLFSTEIIVAKKQSVRHH